MLKDQRVSFVLFTTLPCSKVGVNSRKEPKGTSAKIKKKAKINVNRIHEIERKVHHDVIAFLTSITEKVGSSSERRCSPVDIFS